MTNTQRNARKTTGLAKENAVTPYGLRLGERLYGFTVVRFGVAAAIVAAAVFADRVVGIRGLNVPAFVGLAVVLALCNTLTFLLIRPFHSNPERATRSYRYLLSLMSFTIIVDFLCLTVALWLVGGAKSPFQAFFIFHVIICAVLLSPRATFAHAAIGYLCLTTLVVGTWQGWIPAHYPEGAVPGDGPISLRYVLTILVVQGLLFACTAILLTYMMNLLRQGEYRLLKTNQELDRLSRLRKDFLRITLHNLRSPVGAASMLLSNLESGYIGSLAQDQHEIVVRVQTRLNELTHFLHDLDFLSALEDGDLRSHAEPIDVKHLLEGLVADYQDQACAREQTLVLEDLPDVQPLSGIPRLIREALANFITNAIKYTPEGGHIILRADNIRDGVRIEVEDNGVGIAPADQEKLFQEFVRIKQTDQKVRDAKGSGLGLYIVRRIAEAHGGRVYICSQENQGSIFALELPIASDAPPPPS